MELSTVQSDQILTVKQLELDHPGPYLLYGYTKDGQKAEVSSSDSKTAYLADQAESRAALVEVLADIEALVPQEAELVEIQAIGEVLAGHGDGIFPVNVSVLRDVAQLYQAIAPDMEAAFLEADSIDEGQETRENDHGECRHCGLERGNGWFCDYCGKV